MPGATAGDQHGAVSMCLHRGRYPVGIGPGRRVDFLVLGNNPADWPFHCHSTAHVTDPGIYPDAMPEQRSSVMTPLCAIIEIELAAPKVARPPAVLPRSRGSAVGVVRIACLGPAKHPPGVDPLDTGPNHREVPLLLDHVSWKGISIGRARHCLVEREIAYYAKTDDDDTVEMEVHARRLSGRSLPWERLCLRFDYRARRRSDCRLRSITSATRLISPFQSGGPS